MSPASNGGTEFLSDPDVTIYNGDALAVLRDLPDESVDCCATSPPYWGLRDYGPAGQVGLEPTPAEYVAQLVAIFSEVRRVLTAGGTLWLNLGDSYAQGSKGNSGAIRPGDKQGTNAGSLATRRGAGLGPNRTGGTKGFCKPKDLVGIPWRMAFALQEDGWWLRSDVIWSKPNPMPESVTDRPTKAHEYVFLLAKSERYYFGFDDLLEPYVARPQQRLTDIRDQPLAAAREAAGVAQGNPQGGRHVSRFAVQRETLVGVCGCHDAGCGRSFHADDCGCACHEGEQRGPDGRRKTHVEAANGSIQHRDGERWPNEGRNVRTVWEIPTQPYPGAHFAVFPEELVRRMILGGCPPGGTVLDPFGGSGTTALVARGLERKAVLIELNPDYCDMAARRLAQQSLLTEIV